MSLIPSAPFPNRVPGFPGHTQSLRDSRRKGRRGDRLDDVVDLHDADLTRVAPRRASIPRARPQARSRSTSNQPKGVSLIYHKRLNDAAGKSAVRDLLPLIDKDFPALHALQFQDAFLEPWVVLELFFHFIFIFGVDD